jgi:hypothetical protein
MGFAGCPARIPESGLTSERRKWICHSLLQRRELFNSVKSWTRWPGTPLELSLLLQNPLKTIYIAYVAQQKEVGMVRKNLIENTAHDVKGHPFKAIGIAMGAGLAIGLRVGTMASRD